MSEPDTIESFRIIRKAFADSGDNTAELTAQMLVAVRDFLRKKESAARLERMSVHDIIALVVQ